MQYADIVGCEQEKRFLLELSTHDRMPHALILHGPSGNGKLALAWAFAQYLLCEQPSSTDSCNVCTACLKVNKLIHPDLHFSFPTVGSKVVSDEYLPQWRTIMDESAYFSVFDWLSFIHADNKQGNINRDECFQILRKLSFKTFEGKYKIMILWMPEYLGKEGNRLLKLIEEPPENTLILLVAEQLENILPTIISRCQLIKVSRYSPAEVIKYLQSFNSDQGTIEQVAALVDGDFGLAKQMILNPVDPLLPIFLDWLKICLKADFQRLDNWIQNVVKLGKEGQKHFLGYGLKFLDQLIEHQHGLASQVLASTAQYKAQSWLSSRISLDQIAQIAKWLEEAIEQIERNSNIKILFTVLSIRMKRTLRHESVQHSRINI